MVTSVGRTKKVKDLLRLRMCPMTMREICADLGFPLSEAKAVSSILVGCEKKGEVKIFPDHICRITNRRLKAYMLVDPALDTQPGRRERSSPDLLARQTYQEQQAFHLARDRKIQAWLIFERHTGCRSLEIAEMKAAYRRACLHLHPERGGDEVAMTELQSAWAEIAGVS